MQGPYSPSVNIQRRLFRNSAPSRRFTLIEALVVVALVAY